MLAKENKKKKAEKKLHSKKREEIKVSIFPEGNSQYLKKNWQEKHRLRHHDLVNIVIKNLPYSVFWKVML